MHTKAVEELMRKLKLRIEMKSCRTGITEEDMHNKFLEDAIGEMMLKSLLTGESVNGLISCILNEDEDNEDEIDNTMRIVVDGEIIDNVDVVINGSTVITKEAGVIVRNRRR